MQPLLCSKRGMIAQHRNVREQLASFQKKCWQAEELKRSERVRRGFKGLWDKISGKYFKTRKRNEQETKKSHRRDQNQREELTQEQLAERQKLQTQINLSHEKNHQERKKLIRELSHLTKHHPTKDKSTREREIERDTPDIGFEPEIVKIQAALKAFPLARFHQ